MKEGSRVVIALFGIPALDVLCTGFSVLAPETTTNNAEDFLGLEHGKMFEASLEATFTALAMSAVALILILKFHSR